MDDEGRIVSTAWIDTVRDYGRIMCFAIPPVYVVSKPDERSEKEKEGIEEEKN